MFVLVFVEINFVTVFLSFFLSKISFDTYLPTCSEKSTFSKKR